MGQDDSLRAVRFRILRRERAADYRQDAQCGERPIGDRDRAHLFRRLFPGDGYGILAPDSHIRKGPILFAEDEVVGRGERDLFEVDIGRCLPEGDQRLWFRIGQRFEKDAIDHAEDGAISADADRDREDRHQSEHGGAAQPTENMLEVLSRNCHKD